MNLQSYKMQKKVPKHIMEFRKCVSEAKEMIVKQGLKDDRHDRYILSRKYYFRVIEEAFKQLSQP